MEAAKLTGFGEEHFGKVNLGHKKRNECLIKIATKIAQHPGGTLPDKLQAPKDYKAMDRLVNREEVTHAAVLQPHQERTLELMRQAPGPVLVLHDTTELDYSGLHSIPELGTLGNGHGRGYLCHNSLAVDPQRHEVIGLTHQILHKRQPTPDREGVQAKRDRENRESRLWTRAITEQPAAPADKLWVDIADRGADIFEFLAAEETTGRKYVVRSTHNRAIGVGHGTEPAKKFLHTYGQSLPEMGRRQLTLPGRAGEKDRKAMMALAAAPVQLVPPHVRRGHYEQRPLLVWLVRVWEIDPPAGQDPVEWYLLSNVPVVTAADGWQRVDWYACRWVVEEYHKAQKTGCAIEDMQFTTDKALQAMVALLSVVASLLLHLRQASRQEDAQTRQATTIIHKDYVAVLSAWRFKEVRLEMSVHDFFFALARLGGHQNRKRDHRPGWLVLWRGWAKLQHMVDGAAAVGSVNYKIRG